MGIDYQATIIVGLPRSEFDSAEFIEEEDLHVCPPYFDGNSDDMAIAGFFYKKSGTYRAAEISFDQGKINELKAKFKELTGKDAKIYLSPNGW